MHSFLTVGNVNVMRLMYAFNVSVAPPLVSNLSTAQIRAIENIICLSVGLYTEVF